MKIAFIGVTLLLVVLSLSGSPPLFAAEAVSDEPGAWVSTKVEIKGSGPVAKSWERQLREIEAIIRANPAFRDLRGYYPGLLLKAEPSVGGNGPWQGFVAFEAWWPKAIDQAPGAAPKIKARWEFNRPPGLWIKINSRGDLSHWRWWEDKKGRFYLLPETRREIAGFPVMGDRMFITGSSKGSLFDPLPLERALEWVIEDLRKQVRADEAGTASSRRAYEEFISPAGLEKRKREIEAAAASQKMPENQALERRQAEAKDRRREQDLRVAAMPKAGSPQAGTAENLAIIEKRLGGLSTAERMQPAWIKVETKVRGAAGEIVQPNTPGARPLVTLSTFLDPALPADALQLVTVPVQLFEDQVKGGAKEPQARAPLALVEQTAWRAVQKLLR